MAKATTSSMKDDRAPSTPEEKAAAKAYGEKLDAELGLEDEDNAQESEKEEPAKEPEQETEKVEESTETLEEVIEPEKETEPEPEDPKEKRYREQLAGERKANAELQARLQALETKITTPQQKEMTPEEQQFLEEKKMLKEKYKLVDEEYVQSLLDARLKPIQQKREKTILQNIYKNFPDVSPDKDPTSEKWQKIMVWVHRFLPANPADPLEDIEERFGWGHEKVFGKKTFNNVQARQTSYTEIGGGSSAVKSRTTVGKDKDVNLAPHVRAYKARLDAYFDEEEKQEEARKKRK